MGLFLERSRRVLKLHPEFSERLSDFNRSALWRSNYLLAGALCLAKVRSDGKKSIGINNSYVYNVDNKANFTMN